MVHALRSRRVITPRGELDATVVIEDEIITAVHPASHPTLHTLHLPTEDLGTLALLPGLIDVHTHINEPGRTEWEGFATATRAAVLMAACRDGASLAEEQRRFARAWLERISANFLAMGIFALTAQAAALSPIRPAAVGDATRFRQ